MESGFISRWRKDGRFVDIRCSIMIVVECEAIGYVRCVVSEIAFPRSMQG